MTDATETPSTSHAPTNTEDCVIDVELRSRPSHVIVRVILLLLLFVATTVCTLVCIESGSVRQGILQTAFALGFFLAGLLLFYLVVRKRIYFRLSQLCSKHRDQTTSDLLRAIAHDVGRPDAGVLVGALAELLPRERRVGFVIRFCPPVFRRALHPVSVPFEPLALDEGDAGTLAFYQALNPPDEGPSSTLQSGSTATSGLHVPPPIRKQYKLMSAGWGWAVFSLTCLALYATALIVTGHADRLMIYLGFGLFLLLWNAHSTRSVDSRECWLIVPGGLLVRKASRWRSAKSTLVRYERSEAILVIIRMGKEQWLMSVGDGKSQHVTSGTETEVMLLMRCWLSPLRPLPIDRYSDFGGPA